jgi:hypothetical protein
MSQILRYRHWKPFTWVLVGLHTLLAIALILWATVGNLVAEQQWKTVVVPVQQQLMQQFPRRAADAKALELNRLITQLGFSLLSAPNSSTISNADAEAFKTIRIYLNRREQPLTELLQGYLITHDAALSNIITHLLNHDLPRWSRPSLTLLAQSGNPASQPSLSYGRLRDFQLLLWNYSLLWQYDLVGQSQKAISGITATLKLMQSLTDQSLGIENEMRRTQARILRDSQLVSPNWRQQWKTLQPYSSVADTRLTAWLIIHTNYLKNLEIPQNPFAIVETSKLESYMKPAWFDRLLRPFLQPYLTFAAVDFVRQETLPRHDLCLSRPLEIKDRFDPHWNVPYSFYKQFNSPWKRLKLLLDWEFTDKVLQIKELAAQTGTLPSSVPGIEASTICPNVRWRYEVIDHNQAKLSITSQYSSLKLEQIIPIPRH